MNKVILAGRLTAEPEMQVSAGGTEYVSFTLAVDRGFKDSNGEKQTDFIYCKAWRKTASFLDSYFSKGDGINLEGRLETRKYVDKDGNNRTAYEVVVDRLEFPLGRRSDREEPVANPAPAPTGLDAAITSDDDLPF